MAEKEAINNHSTVAVERAIDELRRQLGIRLIDHGKTIAAFALEFLDEAVLTELRQLPNATLTLLITGTRARAANLANAESPALRIAANNLPLSTLQAFADPLATQTPPTNVSITPGNKNYAMLLTLSKYASLLPSLLLIENAALTPALTAQYFTYAIDADALAHYIAHPEIEVMASSQAALPLEHLPNTKIISFRSRHSSAVHLALIIGELKNAPLTRIHSSCVTGDILGSLRCDCGDQLQMALSAMQQAGSGLLIYLHQEGRGIGISNKLRAYQLQEQGHDTYDANLLLGFEEDERDFSIAAAILSHLGIAEIRLLTNNPHKLSALEAEGIKIKERVPLIAPSGQHNHGYLEAKARKSGHLF